MKCFVSGLVSFDLVRHLSRCVLSTGVLSTGLSYGSLLSQIVRLVLRLRVFSPCPLSQDYRDFAMRFSSSLASVGSGLLGVCQVSAFTFVGCSLSVRLSTVPTV